VCLRIDRVSPRAPRRCRLSTFRNCNNKRELVYSPFTSSVHNMTVAWLETNGPYLIHLMPINKYSGEFHCNINWHKHWYTVSRYVTCVIFN
jgi:hypothetical protein